MARLCEFIDFLIPRYEQEGNHLTVASAAPAGSIARRGGLRPDRHLRERKIDVRVTHRDVARAKDEA
jgi:hypothetical protein